MLRNVVGNSLQSRQETRNAIALQNWFVLEIERADNGHNIWSDYHFFSKSLGSVVLK